MKKIFMMAALALTIVACSTDDTDIQTPTEQPAEQPAKTEGTITITAKLAPKSDAGTRAVADNGDNKITVTWAKTEHLAILYTVGSDKKVADAEITDVDATTGEATISFGVDGSTVDGTACQIVYPLAAAKDDKTGVKDAATLLAAQDGTLNTNLDVRVGNGTIHTSPASLDVTTQPAAQFAIFKFTVKDYAGTADVSVRPLKITIGTQDYVITPTAATNELYAALPAISSKGVSFTATGSDSKTYVCAKGNISFDAGKYYQTTLKMIPGALPGMFTVDIDGKKVWFSQGNLQAVCTSADGNFKTQETFTWQFATNQWDYIGYATANDDIDGDGSVKDAGTVDLFGWVGVGSSFSGAAQYGISNSVTGLYGNKDTDGLKSDWGTLAITNGGNTGNIGWRTLSKKEWEYIFECPYRGSTVNGTENARYTYATINTDGTGVKGIILFPDGVTFAVGEAEPWGNINDKPASNNWANSTKCSTAQWTALAAKGCVFLPITGYRDGYYVRCETSGGYYWSSSNYSSGNHSEDMLYAYCVSFDVSGFSSAKQEHRYYGMSVRLVRDAE